MEPRLLSDGGSSLPPSKSVDGSTKDDNNAINFFQRLFRDHHVEASLVISHLSTSDIVCLALSSRIAGLVMPRCMLRAGELGLLSWRNQSITRRQVADVPFTWPHPLPSDANEPPSPFASWDEAYALKDTAATAHNEISRLVRWTATVKNARTSVRDGVRSSIDYIAAVDAPWTSKGDPNWWLDEPECERVAEKERRADEAVQRIKASVREYTARLATAARTQSRPDIARLRSDTAQMIYESAFYTWFARDYLRDHIEVDDDAGDLLCGLGPSLRTAQHQDNAHLFFRGTIDHVVDLLINRRPPAGANGHGERIVYAALMLVERWCPHTAFVDQVGDLENASAISPDGPERDATDVWTITDPDGTQHTVLQNGLRVHLRKRIGAYAPYLCPRLLRLCVAASIIVRGGHMNDHAVIIAAAATFANDMEPQAIARSLDEALSPDAIARRAFGDHIGYDALTESKAECAVTTNAGVIVRLLVRSLEAVSLLVANFPSAPRAICQLAKRLFCVTEAITTRITWTPRRSADPCFGVVNGRIRLKPGAATPWSTSSTVIRLRMRRANRSIIRALFGATNVDAWAHVIAQPKRHPARRLLIAGEHLDQPHTSPMTRATRMSMRAIQGNGERADDEIRKDADCARRVLLAFGRVLGTATEASTVCHALAVLYDLPPMFPE
nr:hypothetical protein [Pandoravirus aubagnensis]